MNRLIVAVVLLVVPLLGACTRTYVGYVRVFDEEVTLFPSLDECRGGGRAVRGYVLSRIVTGPGRFVLGDREYREVPACASAVVRASTARLLSSGLHELDGVVELEIAAVAR